MDTQTEPQPGSRSPALPIAIVALLLAAASAAVIFFVMAGSSSKFDPIEVAELVPEDTHFFMAFNTDFASEPWAAIPKLLDALGVEQQVRDDIAESADDEGLDFEGEIVPALATIRRAGLAAQYSSDGGELVVFVDSRDPQQVIDLLVTDWELDSQDRDEALGLDFETYIDPTAPSGSPSVLTTHEGVLYLAESTEHISNFISRQQDTAPLSDSQRFRTAIEEVAANSLLVGYGNGNVLDHRDLRDIVDAFVEDSEIDPRDGTLAFAITARDSGFGARVVVALESGFGTFQETVTEPVDLVSIAGMTPDDALVLFAGAGLHDGLVEAYKSVEEEPLVADSIAPFEDLSGLSLKDDLIPLFGSSYAIAGGGDGLTSDETNFDDVWALGLIESNDPVRLSERLELLLNELEFAFCDCDSGITVEDRSNYVRIQWPDTTLSDATLAESPTFISTLELLPSDPTNLLFINLSALPENLLQEASADFASDPDGYDMDLTAILGFAMGVYADETSISVDFVLPINANKE